MLPSTRLKAILLVLMTALVLAACGGSEEPAPTEPPVSPTDAPAATAVPAATDEPAAETAWDRVQAAGKIVVGTAADYPPFEGYDENYMLDGYDIALMTEIAKIIGVDLVGAVVNVVMTSMIFPADFHRLINKKILISVFI